MKTAEEYIKDVESKTGEPFDKKYLEDVLLKDRNDYKQSIIGLIDDRIEHLNPYSKNETILKQVLEELKQKIQSL